MSMTLEQIDQQLMTLLAARQKYVDEHGGPGLLQTLPLMGFAALMDYQGQMMVEEIHYREGRSLPGHMDGQLDKTVTDFLEHFEKLIQVGYRPNVFWPGGRCPLIGPCLNRLHRSKERREPHTQPDTTSRLESCTDPAAGCESESSARHAGDE